MISKKIKEQQEMFKAQQEQQQYQKTSKGVAYVDINNPRSEVNKVPASPATKRSSTDEEYIDFEEV